MTALTPGNVYAQRRMQRSAQLQALRERVRALMADGVERYSVEVADALGLDVRRTYSQVAYALKALELEGVLTSRFESAPRSGLGRRYYRWAEARRA